MDQASARSVRSDDPIDLVLFPYLLPFLVAAPAVSVSELRVRRGGHLVLEDISFEAERGDFVAIVGPNGAGKTTLLRTLLGLVEWEVGRITLEGSAPGHVEPGVIGYVPQVKTLDRTFPAKAAELVLTAARRRWPFRMLGDARQQALAALARVGAKSLGDRPVGSLSGGELQRVYLARGLVRDPRILLLDEPATGVDLAGATDLYEVLEQDQDERGTTILMVTHDWNAAYHHATSVLLIDRQQVSYGPPATALREESLREAFGHIGHAHAMMMDEGSHA